MEQLKEPNDNLAHEIMWISMLNAYEGNVDGLTVAPDFEGHLNKGCADLMSWFFSIIPRNEKGDGQSRVLLEVPGSSWPGGQCEHIYAAYGLKIEQYDGKFWWYTIDGTRLSRVCCYMCRKELVQKQLAKNSMECEHKKPFLRGILDWSLVLKSLFTKKYREEMKSTNGKWNDKGKLQGLSVHMDYIWLLLCSLDYGPSCRSCNGGPGKSNIPLGEDGSEIIKKFLTQNENEPIYGSNNQYEKEGGVYKSGIINEARFFEKQHYERNTKKKILKYLFALCDEDILGKIIGLYRRGKSVNPMQIILDELTQLKEILQANNEQINEIAEQKTQKLRYALKIAKAYEKNLIGGDDAEELPDKGKGERRSGRTRKRQEEEQRAKLKEAKQAGVERLKRAKQAIKDCTMKLDVFKGVVSEIKKEDAIKKIMDKIKDPEINRAFGFRPLLKKIIKPQSDTNSSPNTIEKIFKFFKKVINPIFEGGGKSYVSTSNGKTYNKIMRGGNQIPEFSASAEIAGLTGKINGLHFLNNATNEEIGTFFITLMYNGKVDIFKNFMPEYWPLEDDINDGVEPWRKNFREEQREALVKASRLREEQREAMVEASRLYAITDPPTEPNEGEEGAKKMEIEEEEGGVKKEEVYGYADMSTQPTISPTPHALPRARGANDTKKQQQGTKVLEYYTDEIRTVLVEVEKVKEEEVNDEIMETKINSFNGTITMNTFKYLEQEIKNLDTMHNVGYNLDFYKELKKYAVELNKDNAAGPESKDDGIGVSHSGEWCVDLSLKQWVPQQSVEVDYQEPMEIEDIRNIRNIRRRRHEEAAKKRNGGEGGGKKYTKKLIKRKKHTRYKKQRNGRKTKQKTKRKKHTRYKKKKYRRKTKQKTKRRKKIRHKTKGSNKKNI